MKLTNNTIYNLALALQSSFTDSAQHLPVKVNFYIQKNKATLFNLAKDIEEARTAILQNYGIFNEESGQYEFDEKNATIAANELNDLFNLEQEVQIYTVSIDSFGEDLSLTTGQMEALMFMID